MKRTVLSILPIACILVVAGCDDGDGGDDDTSTDTAVEETDTGIDEVGDPDAGDPAGEDPVAEPDADDPAVEDVAEEDGELPVEIVWETCSLFEGEGDGRAECATM